MELKDTFLDPKLASRYSPAVLIGNWYERRASDVGKPRYQSYNTEYSDQYVEKHCDCLNTKLEEKHIARVANGDSSFIESGEYINNMTTTTDLVYNHLTKDACKQYLDKTAAKHRRKPDLLKSYGNLTHFGLNDWYKCLENKEKCTSVYSLMKDSYRCPKYSALSKFSDRRAVPKAYSSKSLKSNLDLANFKPRNKQILTIPDVETICVKY